MKGNPVLQLSRDLLAHIYSSSEIYRERILENSYAPTVEYVDPLVAVKGRTELHRLLNVYFYFCKSSEIEFQSLRLSDSSTAVVEFNLKITEYTLIGNILFLVGLLPPLALLSYYNNQKDSSLLLQYPSFRGLHCRSTLSWTETEDDANGHLRLVVTKHVEEYSLSQELLSFIRRSILAKIYLVINLYWLFIWAPLINLLQLPFLYKLLTQDKLKNN